LQFEEKLDRLIGRHSELEGILAREGKLDPVEFQKLSKEFADLAPIVSAIEAFYAARNELVDAMTLANDSSLDADMRAMADEEAKALRVKVPDLDRQLKVLLLPKDSADDKNAILEVRAGTGGDEAALFASVLFRMYQRYADIQGWRFEVMEIAETGLGGYKEATASISGRGVFAKLKYESGVHRVQRVPATESSGRIHTSAATVAVLPEAEEVDIHIDEKDLRIDVFRSSGPGGQSVNTTDSAVRITHLPTGVVVQQQDEKSQHKNKAKALKILRARLYDAERNRQNSDRAANRRDQVGSGDRSERIRTYNFPQGRVTDHRINLTLYKVDRVIEGEALEELIQALITEDQAARLADID
jgi:peptide chain release factor 1